MKFQKSPDRKQFQLNYQFKIIPFILLIFSLGLWVYSHHILEINILAAIAFLTFCFASLGLFISVDRWIKSVIPFMLIMMTLPFGNIMDVYLGFPLRLFTAQLVESFLNGLNIQHVSSSTIISIENSATQIDFSCSGLKGLWAGLLFFFAMSWIEELKVNKRWMIALMLFVALLIFANFFRILGIIFISSILEFPEIADIIHAPLGIIGFVLSCTIIYFISRSGFLGNQQKENKILVPFKPIIIRESLKTHWAPLQILILIQMGIIIYPFHKTTITETAFQFEFPMSWEIEQLSFNEEETAFIEEQGSNALKVKFNKNGLSGELLLIKSTEWRGHHHPEFCIRAGGNQINSIKTLQLQPDFSLKLLEVNSNRSACYWFQNPHKGLDDFGSRVWEEIRNNENNWILVSMVFDDAYNNNTPDKIQLIKNIREIISQQLLIN